MDTLNQNPEKISRAEFEADLRGRLDDVLEEFWDIASPMGEATDPYRVVAIVELLYQRVSELKQLAMTLTQFEASSEDKHEYVRWPSGQLGIRRKGWFEEEPPRKPGLIREG